MPPPRSYGPLSPGVKGARRTTFVRLVTDLCLLTVMEASGTVSGVGSGARPGRQLERELLDIATDTEHSLAMLDTLLATAPIGFAFVDRDLRYVRINEALARINGAPVEAHIGRGVREMVPAFGAEIEQLLRQVITSGEPLTGLEFDQPTGGPPGHYLGNFYPVKGSDGTILGVGAIVMDITERKETEGALRSAQEELSRQLEDVTRLLQLSARLSGNLELQPVLDEVLVAVTSLQSADMGVLRLYDAERDELYVVASMGLPEEYVETIERVQAKLGPWGAAFEQRRPIITEDVETDPLFEGFREVALEIGGYRSVYTSPLITRRDEIIGTVATHFRGRRRPSERETRLIALYAYEAADVIDNARLFREAQEARDRLAFLAEASRVLSRSLDYRATLEEVARLSVPRIADWCAVHVVDDHGVPQQLALAHVDPSKIRWAEEIQERYPPAMNSPTGVPNVIRTGRSELHSEISDDLLLQGAIDGEHLELLRSVGMRSAMIVPLLARGRPLGAITFIAAESGNRELGDLLECAPVIE